MSCNTLVSVALTKSVTSFQTAVGITEETARGKNQAALAGFPIDTKDGAIDIQMVSVQF